MDRNGGGSRGPQKRDSRGGSRGRSGGGSGGRSGGHSGGRSGGQSGGGFGGGFHGGGGFSREPREMHKAVCAECKKECEVPFKPTEGKPVYCRDCFRSKKSY